LSSAKKVVGTWLQKRVLMYGVSRQLRHGSDPTCGFVPLPQVGSGASLSVHSDRGTLSHSNKPKEARGYP